MVLGDVWGQWQWFRCFLGKCPWSSQPSGKACVVCFMAGPGTGFSSLAFCWVLSDGAEIACQCLAIRWRYSISVLFTVDFTPLCGRGADREAVPSLKWFPEAANELLGHAVSDLDPRLCMSFLGAPDRMVEDLWGQKLFLPSWFSKSLSCFILLWDGFLLCSPG